MHLGQDLPAQRFPLRSHTRADTERASMGGEAAVDRKRLPGDERSIVLPSSLSFIYQVISWILSAR